MAQVPLAMRKYLANPGPGAAEVSAIDARRAAFVSWPEPSPRVRISTMDLATGAVVTDCEFGSDRYVKGVSLVAGTALSTPSQLRSLADGHVIDDPPFPWNGFGPYFAPQRGVFVRGQRSGEGGRQWRFSLHDGATGAELSSAIGVSPVTGFADPLFARVVLVGTSASKRPVRVWTTTEPEMRRIVIGADGDVVFGPGLARWISWDAPQQMTTGLLDESPVTTIELPEFTQGCGIRYTVGDDKLVLGVSTMSDEVHVVVIDLTTGSVLDSIKVDGSTPTSVGAAVRLDPTQQWVAIRTAEGMRLWRNGTRDVLVPESNGPLAGETSLLLSTPGGLPWFDGGVCLVEQGGLAFYDLP